MKAYMEECETIKATGSIVALCHGENRDGAKTFTEWIRFVKDVGVEEDATSMPPSCTDLSHAAGEIGILSWENVARIIEHDSEFEFGHCGENICVTSGGLSNLHPGDLLQMGRALLVVTQIGKTCDRHCAFSSGKDEPCLLSKSWIFANVVKGGQVCVDDPFIATCCV